MIIKKNRLDNGRSDRIYNVFSYVILTIVLIMVVYPLYFVIVASFSDPELVMQGRVWFFPKGFTLEGYQRVLGDSEIGMGYFNSVYYTLLGTLINMVVTMPAAYALSRRDLKGKGILMIFFLIPMFVTGGTIPTFLVVNNLGILDSVWSLVLPAAVNIFNLIIARTFFMTTIPDEMREAAEIDGCGIGRFFVSIVLPLSKAIIVILILYYGVYHWNSYYSAMLYISDREKFPLQLIMRGILSQNQIPPNMMNASTDLVAHRQFLAEQIKYTLIIASSVPLLVLYPFLQKYFIKGVMIGSVKG